MQLWCPLMCCRPWRSCSAGQMLCAPPGIQPTPPRTSWLSALARSCRWSSCIRTNCAVSNFVTVSSHFEASEKRVSAAHTRFASLTKASCTRKLFRGQCSTQLRCQGNRKNNSCILLAELKKKKKKRKKLTRSHKSVKRPLNQVCKLDFYNHQHHIYSAPIPSTLTSQSCLKPILTAVPPRS